jgi:hypothetical protein
MTLVQITLQSLLESVLCSAPPVRRLPSFSIVDLRTVDTGRSPEQMSRHMCPVLLSNADIPHLSSLYLLLSFPNSLALSNSASTVSQGLAKNYPVL